jgi:hypothetical protein
MVLAKKTCLALFCCLFIQVALTSRVLQSKKTSGEAASPSNPKIDIGGGNMSKPTVDIHEATKTAQNANPFVTAPGAPPPYRLSGKERWIYAGIWALLGLPVAMYGLRFWWIFGWVVGGLAGLNLGNYLETLVQQQFTWNNTWAWVMLVVTIALAVLGAFMFACCKGCVASIMGGYIGFIISNAVISGIAGTNNGVALEWWAQLIVWVACIGVGALIGCFMKDYMVLAGSAVVGGWTFVAGVGTFTGQFPYIFESPQEAWIWWMYLGGAALLIVFGTVWQCADKVNKENGKNNNTATA